MADRYSSTLHACKNATFYVSDIVGLTSMLFLKVTLQQCITSQSITLPTRSVLERKYIQRFSNYMLIFSALQQIWFDIRNSEKTKTKLTLIKTSFTTKINIFLNTWIVHRR